MRFLGTLMLFLFFILINHEKVFAQGQEQKTSPVQFIEPSVGLNVSFFKSTANRVEEISTRDFDEFLVYSLSVGQSINDYSYSLNLAYANDIDSFNADGDQRQAGTRSFEYFYQVRFGITKTLFVKSTKRNSRISFLGSGGVQFRKYFGKENLGPAENFVLIDSNPSDISAILGFSIMFDPNENSRIPLKATISPLSVGFGSEATSYEIATLSVILEL